MEENVSIRRKHNYIWKMLNKWKRKNEPTIGKNIRIKWPKINENIRKIIIHIF
jgi:hypothetical protein